MGFFLKVFELKKDRTIVCHRTIVKTRFSYIIFSLDDGHSIVVIRNRQEVSEGKFVSLGVLEITEVKCDFKQCWSMIKNDQFKGKYHDLKNA